MDHYLEVLALPMIAGWLEVGSLGVVQIWNFSQSLVIYFSTKNGNGPSFANSFRFLQFLPEKNENHWPNVTGVLNFFMIGNLVNWIIVYTIKRFSRYKSKMFKNEELVTLVRTILRCQKCMPNGRGQGTLGKYLLSTFFTRLFMQIADFQLLEKVQDLHKVSGKCPLPKQPSSLPQFRR